MWLIYALYAASKGEDHLHSPLEFLMAGFNAHEKKSMRIMIPVIGWEINTNEEQ
jgi:hypothetical protein